MAKLSVFNNVSLDGYFTDSQGDMSWAHRLDQEWTDFTAQNSKGDATFVFGRRTYEMMASFWPTAAARHMAPQVADAMNARQKVVFSRTLQHVAWNNSRLMRGDLVAQVRKLKEESATELLIFGSGTLVSQLASAGLIDEYRLVVHPLALGSGRTLFEGMQTRLALERVGSRTFTNGSVLVTYAAGPR